MMTSSVSTSLHLSLLESTFLPVYEVGRTKSTLVGPQSNGKGVSKSPGIWQSSYAPVISNHCSIFMPVMGLILTHNGCMSVLHISIDSYLMIST